MDQNLIVALFDVESEAFQLMTELKQDPGEEKSFLKEAALVKKEKDSIKTLDSFDTGADSMNDTAIGGLVGGAIGILGGPLGILLGASWGMMAGSAIDLADSLDNASLIEQIAGKIPEGEVVMIGLADEEDESVLDKRFGKFKTTVARFDAAVVAQEVEEAEEAEKEMARQARLALRKEKNEEFSKKVEEKRGKMKAHLAEAKKVLNTDVKELV